METIMEYIPVLIALALFILVPVLIFKALAGSGKVMICATCGTTGKPKTIVRGSILIEIALWLCFLIPGLIYSLWRSTSAARQKVCPSCLQPTMVAIDSPYGSAMGKKYANQNSEKQTSTDIIARN